MCFGWGKGGVNVRGWGLVAIQGEGFMVVLIL